MTVLDNIKARLAKADQDLDILKSMSAGMDQRLIEARTAVDQAQIALDKAKADLAPVEAAKADIDARIVNFDTVLAQEIAQMATLQTS